MHPAKQGGWVIAHRKTGTQSYIQLNKETDLTNLGSSSLYSEAVFRSKTAKGDSSRFILTLLEEGFGIPLSLTQVWLYYGPETLGSLTWPYIAKQYTFTQDFL